jgi:hypothetical protein
MSRFAGAVPDDTIVFFSTYDVATAFDTAFEAAREIMAGFDPEDAPVPIDAPGVDQGYRSARDGMAAADEFLSDLDGEFAFAAWADGNDREDTQAVVLVETSQPRRTLAAFEVVLRALTDDGPSTLSIDGDEIFVFDNGFAYAAGDDFLVLGTEGGVREILEVPRRPLSEDGDYLATVDRMPSALGTYVYVDLASALRLTEDGIPVDLDEAERALGGMILNAVIEREVVRASGVLTIPED